MVLHTLIHWGLQNPAPLRGKFKKIQQRDKYNSLQKVSWATFKTFDCKYSSYPENEALSPNFGSF